MSCVNPKHHELPNLQDGAKILLQKGFKGKYKAVEELCAPCQCPTPTHPSSSSHPSRFNLDWAQNRGSLVDLFTLNRQARGQNHGALYSLIYSEDFALNYCCSIHTARFERASQAASRNVTPRVQRRGLLTHDNPSK